MAYVLFICFLRKEIQNQWGGVKFSLKVTRGKRSDFESRGLFKAFEVKVSPDGNLFFQSGSHHKRLSDMSWVFVKSDSSLIKK
jgi:hypothetical protein